MFRGTIRQRVLLTYRVDEAWLQQQLPPGFAPSIVDGAALAGICVLRWQGLGPAVLPGRVGLRVDGVAERWFAHRVGHAHQPGVVIPRRWMGSRGAAVMTRTTFGGEAVRSALAFNRHGEDLRVRTTDRDLLDLTVRPAAAHLATARFGGDATAIASIHATATRGWSVCRNASVAATDLHPDVPWAPGPAQVVTGSQRILPGDAEPDHVIVMEDVPARLVAVREALDPNRLAAVADRDVRTEEEAAHV